MRQTLVVAVSWACRAVPGGRLAIALSVALGVAGAQIAASDPPVGRNVNVASGPQGLKLPPDFDLVGDPWRLMQNEPACTPDSRNSLVIICLMNDYSAADVQTAGRVVGDAAIGISQSRDGGLTWIKRLHPLFRLSSPSSPLAIYDALVDPNVVQAAAGVAFGAGLGIDRADRGDSGVFVDVWLNPSDDEDDPAPFRHVLTRIIRTGTPGRFIDRPGMVTGTPLAQMATYNVPRRDGTTLVQTVPITPLHVAFTEFYGNDNNVRTAIWLRSSYDGGFSWSNATKLTEGYAINQGVQMARLLDQSDDRICAVWRRGEAAGSNNEFDAVMFACTFDSGRSFTKAAELRRLVCPVDQDTSPTQFRYKTLPSITADAERWYAVWAEQPRDASGACTGDPRVMISTSADGVSWTPPQFVDPHPGHGAQIEPVVTFNGEKVVVVWTDFRNDASRVFQGTKVDELPVVLNRLPGPDGQLGTPDDVVPLPPENQPRRRHTADTRGAEITPAPWSVGPSFQISRYPFIRIPPGEEHKVPPDAFVAPGRIQAQSNVTNVRTHGQGLRVFKGDYQVAASEVHVAADPLTQPGVWTGNLGQFGAAPTFTAWTDGRDISLNPNEPYFDINGNLVPRQYTPQPLPGVLNGGQSLNDPTQFRPMCVPGTAGNFDQNVYFAPVGFIAGSPHNNKSAQTIDRAFTVFARNGFENVTQTFQFHIPAPPPGTTVSLKQFEEVDTIYAVAPPQTIVSRAVHLRKTQDPNNRRPPVRVDISEVPTAFITSLTSAGMTVTVTTEAAHGLSMGEHVVIAGVEPPVFNGTFVISDTLSPTSFTYELPLPSPATTGAGSMTASGPLEAAQFLRTVWLNPDPSAPDTLERPDSVPPDDPAFNPNNFEVYDLAIGSPNIQNIGLNPHFKSSSSGWETPGWEFPGWEFPGWEFPGWEFPGWEYPGWEFPGWEFPGWEFPGWEFAGISDADAQDGSFKDVTWGVTSHSNTTAPVKLRVLFNGVIPDFLKFQLVAYRLDTMQGTRRDASGNETCDRALVPVRQVLLNIPHVDVSLTNFTSPADAASLQNATVYIEPGETIYVTARLFDSTHTTFSLSDNDVLAAVTLKAAPLVVGTADALAGVTQPPEELSPVVTVPVSNLVFLTQPGNATGGQPIGSFQVQAFDASGAVVPGISLAAAIGTSACSTGAISGDTVRVTGPTGVATFDNVSIDRGGWGYTLLVSAVLYPAVNATSDSFNVEGFCDTGALATGRGQNPATLLANGKVLFSGGTIDFATVTSTAELFDPAGNGGVGTFGPTGSMATARTLHRATRLPNGKVLITGGSNGTGTSFSSAELFDPAGNGGAGSFSATGSMSTARSSHTATLLPNGTVLVAGGTLDSAGAELFDPAGNDGAGSFTATSGAMAAVRTQHTATLLPNGKVLIAGGVTTAGVPLATAEIYDPAAGTFSATGSMGTARNNPAATLLPNGKVLISGGRNASGYLASAELFNPLNGTFTPTGSMGTARAFHASVLLPNGKVLVTGGTNSSGFLASAELFDSATGTFSSTGSMSQGRRDFDATLLPNGKVLVGGGVSLAGEDPALLQGAELFHSADASTTPTFATEQPLAVFGTPTVRSLRVFRDLATFTAALGGVATETQNFELFDVGTPISTIIPGVLDVASPFSQLEVFSSLGQKVLFGFDASTRVAGNGRYDLVFTAARKAIGFDITAQDPATGPARVEVQTVDGTVIYLITNPNSETTPNFIGIISTVAIQGVTIREGPEIGGGGNEEIALDNFVVANVP